MEVKLVARTLELFELYARECRPLSLTEISRGLGIPMSSALALARTFTANGHLYETRKRSGYYPTRKMLLLCRAIDASDPILELVGPALEALRDRCNETVVLGRRQDLDVVYIDVHHSRQAIRYNPSVGELRPLTSNSIGKALFAVMSPEEQKKLVERMPWNRLTPRTIVDSKRLLEDAAQVRARGWAANIGESVRDLAAIAMPFQLAGEWYGVSIVGPLERMESHWDSHLEALSAAIADLGNAVERQGLA
ncbi:IclR family transcriptional regulator [Variovorax paradoxus]|nr:IclR family transcriptional regulator [Variovorax paradoxus]MBT2305117.1 IclR family transcriptional regulator [Variovorax paradoxus]